MKQKKDEVNFTVVAGKKRVGKSNETIKQLLFKYVAGLKRKGIIYDPNNEYSQYKIDNYLPDGSENPNARIIKVDSIPHDKIGMFRDQKLVELRRIVPIDKWGRPLDDKQQGALIGRMMTDFRGGCVFVEDLLTVYGDNIPDYVSGFLSNNAHRDCDVLFHVQDIGRLVPKLWQQCNIVRMHKMLDGVDKSRGKLGKDFEIFKIAENIIEDQFRRGKTWYWVYVHRDEGKIKGDFDAMMFLRAITEYIDMDGQDLIKRYERMRGDNNEVIYTYAQAKQRVKTELFNKYWPED